MKNLSRKLKIRGISFLMTSVFIGMVILLNIFTGMLTERFFLKADITATGLFTISDNANEFLAWIDKPVDIVVLAEESSWTASPMFNMIINTLQNYSAASGGMIRIQYVNPDLNYFDGPEYGNSLTNLRDAHAGLSNMARNDMIFISEFRATAVPAMDLFIQNVNREGRPVVVAVRTDQVLVSALLYVLNENIPHAVFIENHGEAPGEYIRFVLERSGYAHSSVNLVFEEIPLDTTVLFINAPQYDFLNDEIIKLEKYMLSGGNVIVLLDFAISSLPVLEAFLAEWGILTENKLIFDEEHTYPQYGIIAAHIVAGHLESSVEAERYTREVMPIGAFLARPLRSAWVGDEMSGFTLYPLIQTFSDSSYAKSLERGASASPERRPEDDSGPFVIAYNVQRLVRDENSLWIPANLIVTGADMFEDSFLNMFGSTFYNSMFIADLADDFNPGGQNIFIQAKPLVSSQMPVTSGNARAVLVIMVILLPLAIYSVAAVVWYKRRHK